jgi:hypothetical protein
MPIPKDYLEIIEMLNTATQDGRVRWKQSSSGTIVVSVPPAQFEVWAGTDDESERGFVAFGMREARALVDNWHVDEGDVNYGLMNDLYQSAKRQAFGVPEKLQGFKDLLAKNGPIGE